MKKKTLAVPMIGFTYIVLQLDGGESVRLDFQDLPIGCCGFALLFEDPNLAAAFASDEYILFGAFTIKSTLPPWRDAKGEG